MIPILYAGNEQSFLNNGIGRLSDAITCVVTEERNGMFELEMTYPITGIHYEDIAENRIILAKTEDGGNNQAFIIYKISRPLNGIVTIYAQHISYLLNGFVVFPFTGTSLVNTFAKIVNNTVPASIPFTFYTDITSAVTYKLEEPRSVRSMLGGQSGSILDVYGGYDYKFDNFTVSLLESRGADRNVTIRYGKNLTGLKNVDDTTNVYTGIVPYWKDEQGNSVYLTEKVIYSEHASLYPYKIIKSVDFSSDFEEQPTENQLRQRAQSYLTSNDGWKIKNNIDVSFVALYQTEEYKNIAPLERVKLCDTVTVIYEKLGVNVKTKVIKTVYNVLLERYDSISLGDTGYTLSKAIQENIDAPTVAETTSFITKAVDHATKLIQGGLGGHVVFGTNADGEPEEILIMDTDSIDTAINVIRMNLNGIGFSHTGYDGAYSTAWTIDGHFLADFIDTGNLNANLLTVGTIQDTQHLNYWNLATGAFSLSANATVGGKTVSTIVNDAITSYDTSLNQTKVFNKLTNNGAIQGIYMDNNQLYINASYIASGIIADASNNTSWNLTTGALSSKKFSVQSTNFTLTESGLITATGATLENATITSGTSGPSDPTPLEISDGVLRFGNIAMMFYQEVGEYYGFEISNDADTNSVFHLGYAYGPNDTILADWEIYSSQNLIIGAANEFKAYAKQYGTQSVVWETLNWFNPGAIYDFDLISDAILLEDVVFNLHEENGQLVWQTGDVTYHDYYIDNMTKLTVLASSTGPS